MTQYFAFLRAINVGGRRMKMADLRATLEAMALEDVQTLIASGNVVFESAEGTTADLERRIEAQLEESFGFEVATMVRTADQLVAAVDYRPFGKAADHPDANRYISFLREEPDADRIQQLLAHQNDVDHFAINGPHLYWLRRLDMGESAVTNAFFERTLGVTATNRNVTTLNKMIDKFLPDDEAG